jgi:hypothetical protein
MFVAASLLNAMSTPQFVLENPTLGLWVYDRRPLLQKAL